MLNVADTKSNQNMLNSLEMKCGLLDKTSAVGIPFMLVVLVPFCGLKTYTFDRASLNSL